MKSPRSHRWPAYPHIPIFIEADDRADVRSYRHISSISPRPETHIDREPPRHLKIASTRFPSSPPASPATHITNLSPVWSIPEPTEAALSATERSTMRFIPAPRQHVKFEKIWPIDPSRLATTEHLSSTGIEFGLGIQNGTCIAGHTPSSPVCDKNNRSSNIAQRIEERIWQYNSSGNTIKRWLLEIISWWASAICMATIIGVLVYYRDARLPRWPCGLTLNALIAALSRMSGAALILPVSEALGQLKWSWFQGDSKKMWDFEIFDNASRGPWGAFLLLIRTKGKALGTLGAIITLFALALDPSFQQVVDFPERWTLTGNSSIPRVITYAPRVGVDIKAGFPTAQQDQTIQVIAEPFFFDNGTQPMPFGNGTRADIPLSCPSSNCTWPLYETLGVCSSCVQVPQILTWGCLNSSLDWISDQPGFTATPTYGEACGYFLNATSNRPVLMSGYLVKEAGTQGEALLTRILPMVTNPARRQLYGGSINFRHIRNPIMDALIVGASGGPESVYRGQMPSAHECVISWCVKTVKSSYWLATYKEEVMSTFINTTAGPYPWGKVVHIDQSSNFSGTKNFYSQNISIEAPLNGQNSSAYGVSNQTAFTTIFTFDDIFPSYVTVANESAEMFMRYKVAQQGPLLRSLVTNPWVLPNNVTNHVERLATALTNAIRSSDSKEMVNGLAYDKENFVYVRWQWLSLPLGLLFMSLFFLVATIIKTTKERDRIDVRKNSALAMLLFGLPERHQQHLTNRDLGGSPRTKAKNIKVQLLPKGWRISENVFSPMPRMAPKNQPPPGWI